MVHDPRSQHDERAPWSGEAYSTKRHGVTITNCDSEPVMTPGCVQAHGVVLVLRRRDLVVLQVSESSTAVLGRAPDELLGGPVEVITGPERASRLASLLASERVERNPRYAFTLPAREGAGGLDATAHTVDGVVVLELEDTGRTVALPPARSVEEAVAHLRLAASVSEYCTVLAAEVRAITGFDRVLVYRFHPDAHGEVFAECRREDLPSWLGLHYPAEDIPKPAREVFKQVWSRPLQDVDDPLAELVPLVNPETGQPLVMTHCALRGASVMYTEYLRNMGVKAGLTMPIRRGEELWGLIACHHYQGPRQAPYHVRAACELVAQVASFQIQASEDREQALARLGLESLHDRIVARAAREGDLVAMTTGAPALTDGLRAEGAALWHRNRWWRVGRAPSDPELDSLADWLRTRPELESSDRPVYSTDSLAREYPLGGALTRVASGVLAFPISRSRRDLLLWFRPETIHTIDWGGNPHEMPTVPGPHGPRLTPRASFELYRESVSGRSLPWLEAEIAAAARLRVLVMDLVVAGAERLAEANAELERSNQELDAFAYAASHDLKEPLRAIHKYTHQLLEDALEGAERRGKVEALSRLALRMDGLIDSLLRISRVGRTLSFELVDMNEIVSEAMEMVGARTADGRVRIEIPRPLPRVSCDRVRAREVFVNLLSNALKYNDKPEKVVEIGFIAPGEPCPDGSCGPHHATVFYVGDNGIGIEPRYFDQIFRLFRRLHGRSEYGGGTGAGLTIVKTIVERHRGRVWLESTPGQGTRFFFTLAPEEVTA